MDYKIKFEYKGIGKQAASARKQAVQASQKIAEKKGITPGLNKDLVNSINRLIDSNKNLEKSIKEMTVNIKKTSGIGGGARGKGTTVFGSGSGSGLGGVGRSIPIAGIPIAVAGFALQKINQIGNAFIQLAGQQAKTVGYGGFQYGAGMYGATEMGAGMAAYVKSTGGQMGKAKLNQKESKKIRDIGALYGLSAEEIYGQAGTFQRAGGNVAKTAAQIAGGGVESELPILLQGMSGMLEDAIRNGLDASDMARNLGKGLTDLTQATPGRSAHAAMQMVQNFQGVKQSVMQGKMGTMEGLYTAQVSRNLLMQNLQNPNYVKKLQEQGLVSEKQAGEISKMGTTTDYNKLMKLSPKMAQTLLQYTAGTANPADIMQGVIKQAQQTYGTGAEGFQQFQAIAAQQGWSQTFPQLLAQWNAAGKGTMTPEEQKKIEQLGTEKITKGAQRVQGSAAGMAIAQRLGRESLQLGPVAQEFAKQALAFEQQIQSLVKSISPTPAQINNFKETIIDAANSLSDFKDSLDAVADNIDKKVRGFFD